MSDLSNVDIKIDDKDAALILSASLPFSYENFIDFFTDGKDTLSLEEMIKIEVLTREAHHKAAGSVIEASRLITISKGQKEIG